ncbi:hypothetical protein ACFFF5_20465 [Lederbergia wuyishanensis]|uniref:Uncharacterized protein n=1 Tax=Lederbergia wuyishanensis TaxID=1347903 RepID=A0ABU0D8L4_9BACI|nr:hypothetical protein [Lederbergia wuyishanensis]MCJ8007662.1 hypothetical protein [Lederbergia wuyishanensis]MDQ0344754.1 hypothetical protein [Lederbergia wuyishanensis]
MSNERKPKEIHVENLIIHAQNVEVVEERHNRERGRNREASPARDPWGFFWGRPMETPQESSQEQAVETDKEN